VSLSPATENIFPSILASTLNDWLMINKILLRLQSECALKKKRERERERREEKRRKKERKKERGGGEL